MILYSDLLIIWYTLVFAIVNIKLVKHDNVCLQTTGKHER